MAGPLTDQDKIGGASSDTLIASKLKPTGTIRDRGRIQQCLNTYGYCELYPGTWLMDGTSIKLDNTQVLAGVGSNTILKPVVDQTQPVIELVNGLAWEVRLADFLIEGYIQNGIYTNTGKGIYLNSGNIARSYPGHHGDNGPLIEGVRVAYVGGNGIELVDPTGGLTLVGAQLSRINVFQVGGHGIVVNGITDSMFNGIISGDTGQNGFYIVGANNHFVNCKAYFSGDSGTAAQRADGRGYGWNLVYDKRSVYANCEAQDTMHHGWYLDAVGNVHLVNCVSDSAHWNSMAIDANGVAGFYLNTAAWDGPVDLQIAGFSFRTPPTQDFHVYIPSVTNAAYVSGRLTSGPRSSFVGGADVGGAGAGSINLNPAGGGSITLGSDFIQTIGQPVAIDYDYVVNNIVDTDPPLSTDYLVAADKVGLTAKTIPLSGIYTIAKLEEKQYALSDETTAITATGQVLSVRMPFAMTVTAYRISVGTVSSSGLVTVDVKKNGASVFTTNLLTIDANEKTSVTAATACNITGGSTAWADDDELTAHITVTGTGAKGLKLTLIGTR